MREFAEINAVLEHLVDLLHEVTSSLAVRAADVKFRSYTHLCLEVLRSRRRHSFLHSHAVSACRSVLRRIVHFILQILLESFPVALTVFRSPSLRLRIQTLAPEQLNLAILAEQFVAAFTLKGFVRELEANNTLDLLHHFTLELILDFIHLDVQ
jgi:hypothetical protein